MTTKKEEFVHGTQSRVAQNVKYTRNYKKNPPQEHYALAIEKRGKYYYVIKYTIVNKVATEELSEELMRADALNKFKIDAARMFMGLNVVKPDAE